MTSQIKEMLTIAAQVRKASKTLFARLHLGRVTFWMGNYNDKHDTDRLEIMGAWQLLEESRRDLQDVHFPVKIYYV